MICCEETLIVCNLIHVHTINFITIIFFYTRFCRQLFGMDMASSEVWNRAVWQLVQVFDSHNKWTRGVPPTIYHRNKAVSLSHTHNVDIPSYGLQFNLKWKYKNSLSCTQNVDILYNVDTQSCSLQQCHKCSTQTTKISNSLWLIVQLQHEIKYSSVASMCNVKSCPHNTLKLQIQ